MPAPGICCAAPCCGDGGGMAGGTAAENSAAQYYDKATHQSVTEYYDSQHTRQSPNDQHLKHADGQLQSALVLINRGSLQEANDATVANNSLSTHAVHRSRRPTVVPRCPQLRVLLRHPAVAAASWCRNTGEVRWAAVKISEMRRLKGGEVQWQGGGHGSGRAVAGSAREWTRERSGEIQRPRPAAPSGTQPEGIRAIGCSGSAQKHNPR